MYCGSLLRKTQSTEIRVFSQWSGCESLATVRNKMMVSFQVQREIPFCSKKAKGCHGLPEMGFLFPGNTPVFINFPLPPADVLSQASRDLFRRCFGVSGNRTAFGAIRSSNFVFPFCLLELIVPPSSWDADNPARSLG